MITITKLLLLLLLLLLLSWPIFEANHSSPFEKQLPIHVLASDQYFEQGSIRFDCFEYVLLSKMSLIAAVSSSIASFRITLKGEMTSVAPFGGGNHF